jgi:ActR/RegA family two-component response regulator
MVPVQSTSFSLLIVEDDQATRDVMARTITYKFPSCILYTADNGVLGMELFKQFSPEIIISDVINPMAKCIVLTVYSNKINLERIKGLGLCASLAKPLDLNELFKAIKQCSAGIEPEK